MLISVYLQTAKIIANQISNIIKTCSQPHRQLYHLVMYLISNNNLLPGLYQQNRYKEINTLFKQFNKLLVDVMNDSHSKEIIIIHFRMIQRIFDEILELIDNDGKILYSMLNVDNLVQFMQHLCVDIRYNSVFYNLMLETQVPVPWAAFSSMVYKLSSYFKVNRINIRQEIKFNSDPLDFVLRFEINDNTSMRLSENIALVTFCIFNSSEIVEMDRNQFNAIRNELIDDILLLGSLLITPAKIVFFEFSI